MNKTFIITGATGEIGTAICHDLAKRNYSLILAARNYQKLISLSDSLKKQYGNEISCVSMDFSQPEKFNNLIKLITHGIDGLILMPPQPPESTECLPNNEIWKEMFSASFIGPVALIRDLLPFLRLRKSRVILISGISSKQPLSKYATSCVLRTAWLGQIKTLADVYGPQKISFNTLSLGGVVSNKFMEKIAIEASQRSVEASQIIEERVSNIPLRKYANLDEITDMLNFLLNSEAANHITGQNLVFDGGFCRSY